MSDDRTPADAGSAGPDGSAPYAEGADAFYAGKSDMDNPYDLKTQGSAHLSWNDGFMDAGDR